MSINQPETRQEQTAPQPSQKQEEEETERPRYSKSEIMEFTRQENKSPDDFD